MRTLPERLSIQTQGIAHVVHCRRAIHQLELVFESSAADLLEVGTGRDDFSDFGRVGVKESFTVGADNGGIHEEGPTALRRLQHIVQVDVGLQIFDQGVAHGNGIVGVDGRAAEVRDVIFRGVGQLISQLPRGFVRIFDAQSQYLQDVKIRKCRHHQRHHEGDGQNDDGFSA